MATTQLSSTQQNSGGEKDLQIANSGKILFAYCIFVKITLQEVIRSCIPNYTKRFQKKTSISTEIQILVLIHNREKLFIQGMFCFLHLTCV